ncbi:MAG: hypothetical protein ACRBN8_43565 [Nannocystales bacterium]
MHRRLEAELEATDIEDGPTMGRAAGGVFTIGHIALASVLGGGIGGVILMTVNDRRMEHRAVWRSAVAYVMATMGGALLLGLALPPGFTARLAPVLALLLTVIPPIALAIVFQRRMMAGRPQEAEPARSIAFAIAAGWLISAAVFGLLRSVLPTPPA